MQRSLVKRLVLLVAVLAVSACTLPRFQPDQPFRQPPALTQTAFIASDGTSLPLHRWLPSSPKAILIALHGFNDYGTAFATSGTSFSAQGIGLISYDQRGFGRSPSPGIWGGQENLTNDLREIITATRKAYPAVPLYVLGESMGGAVAVAALTDPAHPAPPVNGVILSAPALWGENTLNPFYRFLLWVSAHQLPQMTLTGKGLKILASDNIEMLKALGRDPLVIKRIRIDALYGLVQMMDTAQQRISQLQPPLLFLYGWHDQVIPPKAIHGAQAKMKQPYRFVHYRHGWHMLLRDLQAKRVWKDIAAWINAAHGPLPSGEDNMRNAPRL